MRWTPSELEYEADPRHADIIVASMGLDENSKGLGTPGSKDRKLNKSTETMLTAAFVPVAKAVAVSALSAALRWMKRGSKPAGCSP